MTDNTWSELDERAIKMAKALSADAVQKAGHGHPGSPISLAPIAYTLYPVSYTHLYSLAKYTDIARMTIAAMIQTIISFRWAYCVLRIHGAIRYTP